MLWVRRLNAWVGARLGAWVRRIRLGILLPRRLLLGARALLVLG